MKAVVIEAESRHAFSGAITSGMTRARPRNCWSFSIAWRSKPASPGNCRMFITGSGGNALGTLIGAKFVQEVNAVALAVEKLHPEVNSVIELGGQDAKIIIFKQDGDQRPQEENPIDER